MADAPVNVSKGAVAFWQTAVVPEIIAVGKGFTVAITAVLEAVVHPLAVAST